MFNINDKVRIKNSNDTWNNKEGIIIEEYTNIYLVQVDFNGVDKENFIGTQLGYAFFPSKNFSIEPNARYDFALKNSYEDKFSLGVGFNYFF